MVYGGGTLLPPSHLAGYTDPLPARVHPRTPYYRGMPACSSRPGLWVPGSVGGVYYGVSTGCLRGVPAVLLYNRPFLPVSQSILRQTQQLFIKS